MFARFREKLFQMERSWTDNLWNIFKNFDFSKILRGANLSMFQLAWAFCSGESCVVNIDVQLKIFEDLE